MWVLFFSASGFSLSCPEHFMLHNQLLPFIPLLIYGLRLWEATESRSSPGSFTPVALPGAPAIEGSKGPGFLWEISLVPWNNRTKGRRPSEDSGSWECSFRHIIIECQKCFLTVLWCQHVWFISAFTILTFMASTSCVGAEVMSSLCYVIHSVEWTQGQDEPARSPLAPSTQLRWNTALGFLFHC